MALSERSDEIFETRTVDGHARLADIQDATNHFRLFDAMLDTAEEPLSPELLLSFQEVLKQGTEQAASDPILPLASSRCCPTRWAAL